MSSGTSGSRVNSPAAFKTEALRAGGPRSGISLQPLLHTLQAEFQVIGFVLFAPAFNHSSRNQQEGRAFLEHQRWENRR